MKRVGRAVEFLAWTLFFVFAALVLALRFWLLPDIERYRDHIVAAVSRTVGQPVRIGGIEAGWLGLYPRIHLSDVRIYDREGREALVLPSVDNVIAWRSLLHGELRLHSVMIDGPRLQVRRDAAGALYVAGAKLGGDSAFSDWALTQEEIVIRNAEIEWHDEKRAAPPLALSALNLRMRNAGGQHSVGFTAHPPAALGSTVELRAVLHDRAVGNPAAWSGRLYAELGYTDLAAWRAWIDYPLEVDQGQGAVRLWLTLDRGTARRATADVALAGVQARLGMELAPLHLSSVQGRLEARVDQDGYELGGHGLAMTVEGGPSIAPSDFQVRWRPATDGKEAHGAFAARVLDLEPLAHLGASLPLPAQARQILAAVAPRGRLTEAKLDWTGAPDAPTGFRARAGFSDLAAAPWEDVPGFTGMSGSFEATETNGKVRLTSRKSGLDLPRVFPHSRIALDFLDGQVEWERQGERGFALQFPSLSIANPHFSGNAHGSYMYAGSGPGFIDLSAQFNRADASQLEKYLPHASLIGGSEVRDWLAGAIVAGHSEDVRLRIQGDLSEFPFADPLRGQFSVVAQIDNGILQYVEGWPRIEAIRGELLFERDRMDVVGRSGSVQGVALSNVRASIARLAARDPLLEVTGQADGLSPDFLRFVAASPVREMIDGLTDPVTASGRGRLRLKLALPLNQLPSTRVAGEYELIGNTVVVHPRVPAIERVAGKIAFTESTLSVQEVRGLAFGGALTLIGGTRPDGSVELVARGDATVAATRPLLDDQWLRYFSGSAPYMAIVNIGKAGTRLRVESSLRGVESTLPAPLAKAAGDNLPLRVEITPAGEGERIQATLGRIAAAEILRQRKEDRVVAQRVAVALTPPANQPLRLPERSGTLIYGSLPALDLDKWRPVFAAGEGAAQAAAFDVRIGTLDVLDKRMREIALSGSADAGGWSAAVQGQDLTGDLAYRSESGGTLVARLTHFRLPDDVPAPGTRTSTEPKNLPSMDLVAERFIYRGKDLGRVEVAAQRTGQDWRIHKLTMTNADATFSGNGIWRSGTPSQSSLDFELQASDTGQFLGRVGYPDLVKGGKAHLSGTLSWIGEPALIDYPSLSGNLHLQAEGGQFLEIEPGFGKLISLMSLQSLPRRIALDFRDVFSKGFEFERISSSGNVQRGVMAVKDFRMRGSAAEVNMTGDVDLAKEAQDLRVKVVPSLGDSASTVIALVNPLLAIPAAIAQRILKDPLGHIFAFDYSVTGSWADPKVAKIGIEALPADGSERFPTGQ